jgi:hypothetical protein
MNYDPPTKTDGADSELQEFLMIEKQKAQVNAQVCVFFVKHQICCKSYSDIYDFRFMNSMKYVGINVWISQEAN